MLTPCVDLKPMPAVDANVDPSACFIQRLPVELLSMLFEVGYVEPWASWPMSVPDWEPLEYVDYCLMLSWTCSRFRSIIVRMPKCWSRLHLYISERKTTCENLIPLFLSRSEPRPFDLSIVFDEWSDFTSDLSYLRRTLQKHAHHIRSLKLRSSLPSFTPIPGILDGVHLPSLRLLSVTQSSGMDGDFIGNQISALRISSAPLFALSLDLVDRSVKQIILPSITLGSLKRLHIRAWVKGLSLGEVLDQLVELEHLWWEFVQDGEEPVNKEPVTLSCLLSLRLHCRGISFFPPLIAPCLQQLIVDDTDGLDPFAPDPAFICDPRSSFPLLTRFACSGDSFTTTVVSSLKDKCPLVESLTVFEIEKTVFDRIVADVVEHWSSEPCRRDAPGGEQASRILLEVIPYSDPYSPEVHVDVPSAVRSLADAAVRTGTALTIRWVSPPEFLAGHPSLDAEKEVTNKIIFATESQWRHWPNAWRSWIGGSGLEYI